MNILGEEQSFVHNKRNPHYYSNVDDLDGMKKNAQSV